MTADLSPGRLLLVGGGKPRPQGAVEKAPPPVKRPIALKTIVTETQGGASNGVADRRKDNLRTNAGFRV